MIYKPKNFRIEELVPKEVYDMRGDKSWEILNPKITYSLQELRDYLNRRVVVNDYLWGGKRHNQCFRTMNYYDKLSFSQHLLANAVDPYVEGMTGEELREVVKLMKLEGKLDHVTGIEDNVTWLHMDCRPCERLDKLGLFFFKKG